MRKVNLNWQLVAFSLGAIVAIIVILGGYALGWSWTGLPDFREPDESNYERGKTLWNWLELLIVPSVLAVGALWFNQRATDRQNATQLDRFREEALQSYFDTITALLVDKGLRETDEYAPVADVARVRTVTTLRKLDQERIAEVLDFLRDADLYSGERAILKGARMRGIDLSGANLWRADLSRADLSVSHLNGANLYGTDLRQSDLRGADLRASDLRRARLRDATIDPTTRFDGNTVLPDGRTWMSGTDMMQFGVIVDTSAEDTAD
jgi:hypothetical protein